MVALAAREALAEAGMTLADVDGVFVNYMGEEGSVQVGEYLGIQPRYGDSSDLGGGSFEVFVHHAMLAVAAGPLRGGADRATRRASAAAAAARWRSPSTTASPASSRRRSALPLPIGHYALIASRHMHEYGTTPEQLAEVAVCRAASGRGSTRRRGRATRSPSRMCSPRRRSASRFTSSTAACVPTAAARSWSRAPSGRGRGQAAGPRARRRREPHPVAHQRRCPD